MFNSPPQHPSRLPRVNEILADVKFDSEGFLIKKHRGGQLKDGDQLLVSYHTKSNGWQHSEVTFRVIPNGTYVYTGEKATDVILALKRSAAGNSAERVLVTVAKSGGFLRGGVRQTNLRDLTADQTSNNPVAHYFEENGPELVDLFLSLYRSSQESEASLPRVDKDGRDIREQGRRDTHDDATVIIPAVSDHGPFAKDRFGGEPTTLPPLEREADPSGSTKDESPFGEAKEGDKEGHGFGSTEFQGLERDDSSASSSEPAAYR